MWCLIVILALHQRKKYSPRNLLGQAARESLDSRAFTYHDVYQEKNLP